jgi:general secretion pathway protein D
MFSALALLCLLGYSGILSAQDGGEGGQSNVVGASQKMAERMQQHVREIQALLTQAELDRSDGKYSEAYVGYATALKSVPTVPATADLRRTIFSRYQAGAMDYAKQLAGAGQISDAETVMQRVLADARSMNMDPSAIRPEFRTLMGQLRDPEIYNPTNTAMHQRKVKNVSEALKNADGAVRLGDFDKAHSLYMYVLGSDPYNEAAARGLEMVNRMITEYEKTARDQTRATFIRQVEHQWETPFPTTLTADEISAQWAGYGSSEGSGQAIQSKLSNIVISSVQFDGAPLRDVLDFLAGRAAELDSAETDPSKRGVNIVIDNSSSGGEDLGARQVTIKLSRVPLGEVLRYVTGQVQLKFRVDPYAITVVPLTASDDAALVTRSFLVPPDFIQGDGDGGGAGPIDPFAAPAPAAGGLVKRITATEFLKSRGIDFPQGASATFVTGSNMLIVHNTPDAIALVDSMVVAARSQGSKMVMVDFRMISVSQLDLEEMSFDWLLAPFNVDSGATTFVSGGNGPGNQVSRNIADFPFRYPGSGNPVGTNPLTAGNRSGDVKTSISIEDVLARSTPAPASTAAPGVFGLANIFSDPAFQVVWRGLDQGKGVDRLCESKVLVKPGQTAAIRAVREFIYPTEYDPPEVPQNTGGTTAITIDINGNISVEQPNGFAVTPAHPTAFEMRELGKVMEVQPLVDDDNISVNLTVSVDISEFLGFINYGTPIRQLAGGLLGALGLQPQTAEVSPNRILQPVFEAVKETTNVQIYDGQTILIGGFLGDSVTDVEDGVPFLGEIPVVGKLFRSSVEDRTAKAIMLFVSVRIVDPAGAPINQDLSKLGQAQ